jgi:membrane-bound lytic murein transglycosylase MltF
MQVMPRTGKEMGVGDITKAEPNVHGGTKYIRVLFDRYFKDANFDEQNRTLFVFASDNAGPSRIAKLRGELKIMVSLPLRRKLMYNWAKRLKRGGHYYLGS